MKISAVLFDLDGTLTDSTRIFYAAVSHGLAHFGIELQLPHFIDWHAQHSPWEELLTKHGGDGSHGETLKDLTFAQFNALLAEDSQWLEGAEETVGILVKRGIPIAIISNSRDEFIDTMSKSLPLKELFPIIITASFTQERRKPDPYGLLVAAERLGVLPQECLYVGDQKFDIRAANAAGMHDCLIIGPHTPADAPLMAKHTVQSLPEILGLID